MKVPWQVRVSRNLKWERHLIKAECYYKLGEFDRYTEEIENAVDGIIGDIHLNNHEKSFALLYIDREFSYRPKEIFDFYKSIGGFLSPDNKKLSNYMKTVIPGH